MLHRRTVLAAGATAATAPLLVGAPAEARPRVTKVLAKDLQVPWGVAFLPNGDALVGERPNGRVHRVRRRGGRSLVGRLSRVRDDGEGGLLGIAVGPTFADDRWVYLYFTSKSGDNRIVRKRFRHGELGRTHLLLDGIPSGSNHDGGRLAFGPDGHLYASTGDSGDSSLAQDKESLAGKVLRMTPSGRVPDDNPFDSRVWTFGHRNVEGITWDHRGRMWATELGQSERDELNRIRRGRNYGWPEVEGGDGSGPYADPFVTWSPTSTCSPSGVAIAKGRAWVGALAGQALYSVRLAGPHAGRVRRHLHEDLGRIRTVQKAPDGSLWLTTSNRDGRADPGPRDDRVLRLTV